MWMQHCYFSISIASLAYRRSWMQYASNVSRRKCRTKDKMLFYLIYPIYTKLFMTVFFFSLCLSIALATHKNDKKRVVFINFIFSSLIYSVEFVVHSPQCSSCIQTKWCIKYKNSHRIAIAISTLLSLFTVYALCTVNTEHCEHWTKTERNCREIIFKDIIMTIDDTNENDGV